MRRVKPPVPPPPAGGYTATTGRIPAALSQRKPDRTFPPLRAVAGAGFTLERDRTIPPHARIVCKNRQRQAGVLVYIEHFRQDSGTPARDSVLFCRLSRWPPPFSLMGEPLACAIAGHFRTRARYREHSGTLADKRRAVETLLRDEEWGLWSSRQIANKCGVSHTFVDNIRPSLATVASDSTERTYPTKHGTVATMNTAGIGKREEAGRFTSGRTNHAQNRPYLTRVVSSTTGGVLHPPAPVEPSPARRRVAAADPIAL